MWSISSGLVWLIGSALVFQVTALQLPFGHEAGHHQPKHKGPDPFGLFVNHFDLHRVATDTYLQTRFNILYPDKSVIVTQDPRFQLLAYAGLSNDSIMVRERKDIESLKRSVYLQPSRRRDGSGKVAEGVLFAGYEVAWKNYEFLAVVATWSEGYFSVTQWHLISDNPLAAYQLIHDCAYFSSQLRDAILVFDRGYWQPDPALWQAIQQASWDDVILEDKFKKAIQNDYRSFFKSEEIYKHLQVPWKRGLMFLGPPGNGKTISLKAIMKDVSVPLLYVKSFHTYAGDEIGIREVFKQARNTAPCVLILEDLDSLINDQNRAFFLNELDGLEDNDGLLLIGSTNHFDRLDPALSNRPSRFDRKYNFPNPSKAERRDYAVYWQKKLSDKPELDFPDSLVDKFADKTDKFSFAYMKEAFISTLLLIAGKEKDESIDFGAILLDQVEKLAKDIEDAEGLVPVFGSQIKSAGGGYSRGPGGREEGEVTQGIVIEWGQEVFGNI